MKCGIYKITNCPTGKIYVGQSCNIDNRFKSYKNQRCTEQPKLFKSLCKYGYINHKFEIIEECSKNDLNNKERYWQDFYDVLGVNGLNSILIGSDKYKCVISDDSRFKMGSGFRGKPTVNSIKVKNIYTNEIFRSIKECARLNNIKYSLLKDCLSGRVFNKLNQFIYLKNEII